MFGTGANFSRSYAEASPRTGVQNNRNRGYYMPWIRILSSNVNRISPMNSAILSTREIKFVYTSRHVTVFC